MWKPISFFSTIFLSCFSLCCLGIIVWFSDNFKNIKQKTSLNLDPYLTTIHSIIACDVLVFLSCFVGLFFLIRPNISGARSYCILIVILLIYKIIAGAVFYSGVDNDGKTYNENAQYIWNACEKYSECEPPDNLKAWHTARGFEVVSIILFTIIGLCSGWGVLKVSNGL